MNALLAAAPLAVVLLGMTVLRRPAALAGAAGLVVAGGLWAAFGLGGAGPGAAARTALGAFAEAGHSAATIIWIIFPALTLYEFQRRSGALDRIRSTLASLSDDRRIQTLLIAWFFGLFMEGAAGFGTPVALAAPLLAGLGRPPVRAVALALLGHAAGVSFGAVGTPVLAQVEITGLTPGAIAAPTAALHALAGPVLLIAMTRLAGDGPLTRRDLGWAGAAALCFFVPSVLLALLAGPELPTLGGALLGAAAFIALLRRRRPGAQANFRALLPDLAPYVAILALVLATRLVPPVQEALTASAFSWTFDGRFRGIFLPLHHPGAMLLLGLLAGAAATGRAGLLPRAARAAALRLPPVALALLTMLTLSRFMVHAGMIGTLAETTAGAGSAWPAIAPLVGVLGTFITGSATSLQHPVHGPAGLRGLRPRPLGPPHDLRAGFRRGHRQHGGASQYHRRRGGRWPRRPRGRDPAWHGRALPGLRAGGWVGGAGRLAASALNSGWRGGSRRAERPRRRSSAAGPGGSIFRGFWPPVKLGRVWMPPVWQA